MRIHPTHRDHIQADMFRPTAMQGRLGLTVEPAKQPDPKLPMQQEEARIAEVYERSKQQIRRNFKRIIDTYPPEPQPAPDTTPRERI